MAYYLGCVCGGDASFIGTYIYTHTLHTYRHTYIQTHTNTYTYTHAHTYTYTYINTYVHSMDLLFRCVWRGRKISSSRGGGVIKSAKNMGRGTKYCPKYWALL